MRERLSALIPRERALWALGLLLLAGIAVRLYFMTVWRPALIGFPDTSIYLLDAFEPGFWDPLRVVGYGFFLQWMHDLGANLSATILVQHALGIASAVLLYDAVRRGGGPSWLGLAPAAAILLGGQQIFLEHSVLSEPLFGFFVCAAVWSAMRALDGRAPLWSLLSGALIGAVACTRLAGVFLLPAAILWLALHAPGAFRRRLIPAAAVVVGAALVIGPYVIARHDVLGSWGMTTSGGYNLYARAATFADCDKFDPPEGTELLCEERPPEERPGPSYYAFGPSPAQGAFGGSAQYPSSTEAIERVRAFAVAAIVHQPFDYARTVGENLWRFVAPDSFAQQSGNSPDSMIGALLSTRNDLISGPLIERVYGTVGSLHDPKIDRLVDYERHTRIDGVVFVLLLLLSLVAAVLARGRARAGVDLFGLAALALALAPVMTVFYDARYAVPVHPLLAATAAFGAWLLWVRVRHRNSETAEQS